MQDIDAFLERLPKGGNEYIIEAFKVVFNTGTSAYWHKDRELVKGLSEYYEKLDELLFRPWAQSE